ncbi:MAG: HAD-like domain-containing protein [Linnemannia elongata]|nr:MAG: HAD-like domain-containing protein [Linnemannia elongata]
MLAPVITFHRSKTLPTLLVTDLDGTLLNPQHTISPRSIKTLSLAQSYSSATTTTASPSTTAQHTQIMIASGRSPRSIQKVIDLFQGQMIPDAVICCNGALNYNPRTRQISVPQFMPLDQALEMVQTLRVQIRGFMTPREKVPEKSLLNPDQYLLQDQDQNQDPSTNNKGGMMMQGRPGFSCEVIYFLNPYTGPQPPADWTPQYAQDTTFVCDKTWESERKHSIYYDYESVDSFEHFVQSLPGRGGIVKLMALDRNRTAPAVYESLPSPLTSPTATTTTGNQRPGLTLTYSGNYFLEISAAGVNKGLGLSAYCTLHNIPREEVVAFGDLLNDAEMLQFAGLGLCMGNGHEDMKKLADRVIGTNAEDGLAVEIESWYV